MKQAKSFRIIGVKDELTYSNSSIWSNKLWAVKTIKDVFGCTLKDAKDLIDNAAPNHDIILDCVFTEETVELLSKYLHISVNWGDDEPIFGHNRQLSPEEEDAIKWYDNLDALTKVMIDNYIKAIGYGPIPSCY